MDGDYRREFSRSYKPKKYGQEVLSDDDGSQPLIIRKSWPLWPKPLVGMLKGSAKIKNRKQMNRFLEHAEEISSEALLDTNLTTWKRLLDHLGECNDDR